jgi:hypothetical protein
VTTGQQIIQLVCAMLVYHAGFKRYQPVFLLNQSSAINGALHVI